MNVLLTGASGFIGRQADTILQEKGYDVHAVSHEDTDLLNAADRKRLIETVRPTHVLHFAWIATPGVYWTSPLNAEWKEATVDLLRLSRESGVERFVSAGSSAEYDWSTGECDELKTPLHPATPYGLAKAETGKIVIAEKEMSTAWGRIFFLYGPHEHPNRLVSSVIRSLLGGKIAECTHGRQVRDFMHVRDVADAFVSLLASSVTGPVNIASGESHSIREIVEEIAQQIGREDLLKFDAIPASPSDPERLIPTVERLQKEVGWRPSFSLKEGITDTINWWKQHEAL